ncbi:MAG TPA: hypothetical protein VJ623_01460 [Holophagaceae bacterium]|nr:hypothetical protein [Holophagaceae bacterium]
MRTESNPFKALLLLAGGLGLGLMVACGSSEGPTNVLNKYGNHHPATWIDDGTSKHANDHQGQAVTKLSNCLECHALTKQQAGSGVPGCLTTGCHHQTVPNFRTVNHQLIDPTRASACAICHYPGSLNNPVDTPNVIVPGAGASPNCFNGTLCHGDVAAPHPTRANSGGLDFWRDPKVSGGAFHGDQAKQNLRYCQGCHGTPGTTQFNVGPQKCTDCHNPTTGAAAHPSLADNYAGLTAGVNPSVWNQAPSASPYVPSHRDMGNAATADWKTRANDAGCNICHNTASATASPLPAAPTCFSATFAPAGTTTTGCHASGPGSAPHPLGAIWKDPGAGGGGPTVFHGAVAKQDLLYCQTCHGTPGTPLFDGGSASTACSSCHKTAGAGAHPSLLDDYSSLGGSAPTPKVWNPSGSTSPYVPSHRTSGNLTTSCAICHKVDAPATVPSSGFNGPLPSAPNCWSVTVTPAGGTATSCHANGPSAAPPHPIPFLTVDRTTPLNNGHIQATAAIFTSECSSCHIMTGTPTNSAPACVACHTSAATNPPTAPATGTGTCLSCHNSGPSGLPAGPSGGTYPNIAGAHAKHMALPGVTCATCHNALGTGTVGHYNAANARVTAPTAPGAMAFLAAYNAKSGAITASAAVAPTCSNVACHGGKVTPVWTGSLPLASGAGNSNSYCLSCHASGTTQFNSWFSGEHSKHVGTGSGGAGAMCTDCHNVTSGATGTAHWSHLETTTFEGAPAATIQFSARANFGVTPTYVSGRCNLTCHTASGEQKAHSSEPW